MTDAVYVIRYHRRMYMRMNPSYGRHAAGHRFAVWTKKIGEAEKFGSIQTA